MFGLPWQCMSLFLNATSYRTFTQGAGALTFGGTLAEISQRAFRGRVFTQGQEHLGYK